MQEVITKAINGEIPIGSYSPIRPRNVHLPKDSFGVPSTESRSSSTQDAGQMRKKVVNSDAEETFRLFDQSNEVLLDEVLPPPPVKSRPAPRRDEKLRELMRAIESYDR